MREEFKAEVERLVERARILQEAVVWEDSQDEESSAGFAAEPEKEEEEEDENICPFAATKSPFAFETPKTVTASSPFSRPFTFSSPASDEACIKLPDVSTPPGLPEVSPEKDTDEAKQMLQTIQDLKEEIKGWRKRSMQNPSWLPRRSCRRVKIRWSRPRR